MGNKDRRPELERAIGQMYRKTKDLRRQLRKAVVDHVSDSFLETTMPLLDLIEVRISTAYKFDLTDQLTTFHI